jgi:hypothetical protein
MKVSFLEPFKKEPHETQLNPFHHSMLMGSKIGSGRLTVMFQFFNNYKEVVLVDTFTGERLKIELNPVS